MGTPAGAFFLLFSCPAADPHRWSAGVRTVELRRSVDHRAFAQTMRVIGGASLDDHMSEARRITDFRMRAVPGPATGFAAVNVGSSRLTGNRTVTRDGVSKPWLLDMFPQAGRAVFFARRSGDEQVMTCRCADLTGMRHSCCPRVAFDRSAHELYCATDFLTTHGEQSQAFAIV